MEKLIPFILLILLVSCKAQEKITEDPKMIPEAYIWVDNYQLEKIKKRFERNDLTEPYIEYIVNDNRYIISMPYSSLNARKWWGYLIPYNARITVKAVY